MISLDSLFSRAKVFFRAATPYLRQAVRVVLEEIDKSPFGRAATAFIGGAANMFFGRAQDLAQEEAELAEKAKRDKRWSEAGTARLHEIEAERQKLREQMEREKGREAATEIGKVEGDLVSVPLTSDEVSATTALWATKQCQCGGTMTIRQGRYNTGTGKRQFYWQCTAARPIPCKPIYFDPTKDGGGVLRKPDADLDGDAKTRRRQWNSPGLLAKTHARVRQALEETDKEIICPRHVLPLKMVERRRLDRTLLGSYEFVCMGVNADGTACDYSVPVESAAQVSAMLRRREGVGILDS